MMKTKHVFAKQKGVALLIVMLIMALMTTVAATMSGRMFVNFNRVESQVRFQQAYWYALSVEDLVKFALANSINNDGSVTLSQAWSVRDQAYPIDDWVIQGSVFDEQACFNLNGLRDIETSEIGTNPPLVLVLQRLIESQGVDSGTAELIAASTWEYIDEDNNTQSSQGQEDAEYEGRVIPHVAANGFLSDVTEWRAVNGVTKEIYQRVVPFLCALPTSVFKINVNTLEEHDAPLLAAAMDPYLSEDDARSMINDREPIDGWSNIDDFFTDSAFSALQDNNQNSQNNVLNTLKSYIDIKSQFFEADTKITLDETQLRVRSLLQRNNDGEVNVVRRRFGGTSERDTGNTPEQ